MGCVVIVVILYHDVLTSLVVGKHLRWTWRAEDSIISEKIVEIWDVLGRWSISWPTAWILFHYIVHHWFDVLLRNVVFLRNLLFLGFWSIFYILIKEVEWKKRAVIFFFFLRRVMLLVLNVDGLCLLILLLSLYIFPHLALAQILLWWTWTGTLKIAEPALILVLIRFYYRFLCFSDLLLQKSDCCWFY